MEHTLYTIGYAGKDIDSFISCLKEHGITCLVDVRSSPFSKTFPDFDKPRLKETLKKEGILYAHFGEEFGARRVEKEAYSIVHSLKGEQMEQVDFQKVYNLEAFQKGVNRILDALKQGYRICFMCSEKHPVDCHRFWMVGYYFYTLTMSFDIVNIISSGVTQSVLDVINDEEYEKEKAKFYKNHEELRGVSLFEMEVPAWVKEWDDIFSSNEHENNKRQLFFNRKIGYSKGNNEND